MTAPDNIIHLTRPCVVCGGDGGHMAPALLGHDVVPVWCECPNCDGRGWFPNYELKPVLRREEARMRAKEGRR